MSQPSSLAEKGHSSHVEHEDDNARALDVLYKSKAYKRGLLKVDVCVTGVCMLLYLFSFLDKANLGNARVAGLQTDLGLSTFQYSLALTVLYIPYIAAELPSNLVLKKVGAHYLLPTLTFCFGLICCLQGLVTSYAGLLVCRILLGLFEGGLIPAIILYMSTFYRRDQFQLRASFLFSFAALAGAFSGLLAAAIVGMDGLSGRRGWAWIFIIEGAATMVFAIIAAAVMSPDIEHARWLNQEEKVALRTAFNSSGRGGETEGTFSWSEVASALTSPFTLLLLPAFMANGLVVFGTAYFQPTIVRTLGYSAIGTQLYSVPPYAVVFCVSLFSSYFCDKHQIRGYAVSIFGTMSVVGYAMNLSSNAPRVRYAALFLQAFGGYAVSPVITAWLVDNIAPMYKRGTAIAISFIATQLGGIISTWIYPAEESPRYHTGASVSITAAAILAVSPLVVVVYLKRENGRKARVLAQLGPDHVYAEGPMKDTDVRYVYVA